MALTISLSWGDSEAAPPARVEFVLQYMHGGERLSVVFLSDGSVFRRNTQDKRLCETGEIRFLVEYDFAPTVSDERLPSMDLETVLENARAARDMRMQYDIRPQDTRHMGSRCAFFVRPTKLQGVVELQMIGQIGSIVMLPDTQSRQIKIFEWLNWHVLQNLQEGKRKLHER